MVQVRTCELVRRKLCAKMLSHSETHSAHSQMNGSGRGRGQERHTVTGTPAARWCDTCNVACETPRRVSQRGRPRCTPPRSSAAVFRTDEPSSSTVPERAHAGLAAELAAKHRDVLARDVARFDESTHGPTMRLTARPTTMPSTVPANVASSHSVKLTSHRR